MRERGQSSYVRGAANEAASGHLTGRKRHSGHGMSVEDAEGCIGGIATREGVRR